MIHEESFLLLRKSAFVLAIGLLAVPAIARNLNPGKWRITVETQVPGMKMPPAQAIQCITKQKADSAEGALPSNLGSGKDDDCKLSDLESDGDRVTYKLTCPRKQMTGQGAFHYAGDTFEGTMQISMPSGEIRQTFAARRVGECDR